MEEPKPIRLDIAVNSIRPELTRSMATKIIKMGLVTVNGKKIEKSSSKIRVGDKVVVNYVEEDFSTQERIEIPVVYEDDNVIVINKPEGLLTHSKGNFNPEQTVETWLAPQIVDIKGPRAGIVHRLDRATSGVMILAKTNLAYKKLTKQFADRKVKKTYIAIVDGELKESEALIDLPIQRNPKHPNSFKVGVNGKASQTSYKVLKTNDKYSLLELKPTTGRTHQLRVHLTYLKHPIAGDFIYGGTKQKRMYLHAKELEITLPNSERKVFTVPLPKSFKELI